MKCPKCELPSMTDTGARQHDNCIVWFCPRCGRKWTFFPNGVDRTVQVTWDYKYIDYLWTYEKMPKDYIREMFKLYPEHVPPPL